jgi:hypothetical protein
MDRQATFSAVQLPVLSALAMQVRREVVDAIGYLVEEGIQ